MRMGDRRSKLGSWKDWKKKCVLLIFLYIYIILLSLEEKGGMGGKQCGATKHNRARVTKDHKYARPETFPVVVSECECVVRG